MEYTIKAYIVEDEEDSLNVLQNLLKEYCPNVKVIGASGSVNEAVIEINKLEPELIFLDISLPDGEGFNVLERINNRTTNVIFVTAYNQYAIKAFEFSAVHYLLKPIRIEKLQQAINKLEKNKAFQLGTDHLNMFKENYDKLSKLLIPCSTGFNAIDIEHLVRCETHGSSTWFHMADGSEYKVAISLNNIEEKLRELPFIRIHINHIIHLKYVVKYYKGQGGDVKLVGGKKLPVSARRKTEFLEAFESYAKKL